MDMQCNKCKYLMKIGNTKETGSALCSRGESYFPVECTDSCHYMPEKKELCCRDCARFGSDFGCFTAEADDSAYYDDGELCMGFSDIKEKEFNEILMFWKAQDMYDRDKIEKMLDEFEECYRDIEEQPDN